MELRFLYTKYHISAYIYANMWSLNIEKNRMHAGVYIHYKYTLLIIRVFTTLYGIYINAGK